MISSVGLRFFSLGIALCLLACIFSTGVLAEDVNASEVLKEFKSEIKRYLNENMEKNSILKIMFGNEKINVYVKNEKIETFYVITKNGIVTEIGEGELSDRTMNMYTDIKTIQDIADGKINIKSAIDSGRIKYEGVGPVNSIKVGIAMFTLKIVSFFGGLFGGK